MIQKILALLLLLHLYSNTIFSQIRVTFDHFNNKANIPLQLSMYDENGLIYQNIGEDILKNKASSIVYKRSTPIIFSLNGLKYMASSCDSLHIFFNSNINNYDLANKEHRYELNSSTTKESILDSLKHLKQIPDDVFDYCKEMNRNIGIIYNLNSTKSNNLLKNPTDASLNEIPREKIGIWLAKTRYPEIYTYSPAVFTFLNIGNNLKNNDSFSLFGLLDSLNRYQFKEKNQASVLYSLTKSEFVTKLNLEELAWLEDYFNKSNNLSISQKKSAEEDIRKNIANGQTIPSKILKNTNLISFSLLKKQTLESLLDEHKRKNILLCFWASWCKPCLDNLPKIKAYENATPETVTIFISLDDDISRWQKSSRMHKIVKKQYLMKDSFQSTLLTFLKVHSIPLYIRIDKKNAIKILNDISKLN